MATLQEIVDMDNLRPLICRFESTTEVAGHIEYLLNIKVPHVPNSSWCISKRYNDFVTFSAATANFGLPATLPPKKTFGNKDREFIAERQAGLQSFFRAFLDNLFVLSSKPLKQFILPGPKIADISNSATQLMAMVFRTDGRYEITENLPGIGWRVSKEFALVRSTKELKQKLLSYWVFYGQDRVLPPADISGLLTSFTEMKHPFFFPLVFSDARDTGCVIVRPDRQGSLYDQIRNAKYRLPFLQKYSLTTRKGKGHSLDDVQRYGRQILEALKFFHDNGIPYGNLSSRNVIIDGANACVTETESALCGLRSFYWPYLLEFRKINTFEAVDVYCFGHVLYEMVFGCSLQFATCEKLSSECPPLVRAVLESILTPEACKAGMPSVSQLLTQPFFSQVVLNPVEATLKIPRKLKQALVDAKMKMEERMAHDQQLFHNYKKEMRVKSFQSSEDERKKRKLQTLKSQISSDLGDSNTGPINQRSPTPNGNLEKIAESTSVLKEMTPRNSNSAPPPPGPPPPPSFTASSPTSTKPAASSPPVERGALLASIRGFKKDDLSHAETVDKSAPVIFS